MNLIITVLLIAAACLLGYMTGRYRGKRRRVKLLPWRVEHGTAREMREASDSYSSTRYINVNRDLVVRLRRGTQVLHLGTVNVQSDNWEEELGTLLTRAEDRANGLNAHLEEVPR